MTKQQTLNVKECPLEKVAVCKKSKNTVKYQGSNSLTKKLNTRLWGNKKKTEKDVIAVTALGKYCQICRNAF
jgi:hypothetical protein